MSKKLDELNAQIEETKKIEAEMRKKRRQLNKRVEIQKQKERAELTEQVVKVVESVLDRQITNDDVPVFSEYINRFKIEFCKTMNRE